MGIFSFLFGRKKVTQDDLDFEKWMTAHRSWRDRLESSISGANPETFDPDKVSCDDGCDLGKWIYGSGGNVYGEVETFKSLKDQHAEFHICAGKVARCCNEGDMEAAKRNLSTCFTKASIKVLGSLQKMKIEVDAEIRANR